MNKSLRKMLRTASLATLLAAGCAAPKLDFSEIERPARAEELDPYSVFVGKWQWEAELLNAEGTDRNWDGTAEWRWTMDERALHGTLSARSARLEYEAGGFWSWHPVQQKYIWLMFNDWGYPQQGDATYDEAERMWTMDYKGVGLDGTTSYGRYTMKVITNDHLEWTMTEWADSMHTMTKMEMKGEYHRVK